MLLHRALAYRELARDLLVGIAARDKIEDGVLSSCDSLALASLGQDHLTPPFVPVDSTPAAGYCDIPKKAQGILSTRLAKGTQP